MGKFSGKIYRLAVKVFKYIPFKKQILLFVRSTGVNPEKFYLDFSFSGFFKLKVEDKSVYLYFHNTSGHKNIFWFGVDKWWERDFSSTLLELVKDSKVIVDVGANTGMYSLMASVLRPDAKIFAFEPATNLIKNLNRNIKKNNFKNVQVVEKAVSNFDGIQLFYDFNLEAASSASLSYDKVRNIELENESKLVKRDVETIKLDTFFEENNIEHVDLIKIDVELHEPEVLEGYQKLINKQQPIIILEILRKQEADKISNLMDSDVYSLFYFSGYKQIKETTFPIEAPYLCNYLLIPKSKIDSVKKIVHIS